MCHRIKCYVLLFISPVYPERLGAAFFLDKKYETTRNPKITFIITFASSFLINDFFSWY